MTNGSSQGLFVVVAVVIFGIFVAISYTLFRDTLTPSLASIFGDTLLKVSDESVNLSEGSTKLTKDFFSFDRTKDLTPESEEFTLEATNNEETGSWLGLTPKGIIMNRGNLYVPYGKRLTYYVDVYSELDITFSIDFNAQVIDDTYINGNDNYGKHSGVTFSHQAIKIKAGEWSRISFWYENNHAGNINKEDIEDFTLFGFSSTDGNRLKEENKLFKIKNISYKIE